MLSRSLPSLTLTLLSGALLLSACKKDDPEGALTGRFQPADAIREATVRDRDNHLFGFLPRADGSFTIENLTPGSYSLLTKPVTGYDPLAARTVEVKDDETLDLGTLTVAENGAGRMFYRVNGKAARPLFVTGNYSNGRLSVQGDSAYQGIDLNFGSVSAPGAYPIQEFGEPSASYKTGNNTENSFWVTFTQGGSGTIELTRFDLTRRRLAGTFSFVAPAFLLPATGTRTITEGRFENVPF